MIVNSNINIYMYCAADFFSFSLHAFDFLMNHLYKLNSCFYCSNSHILGADTDLCTSLNTVYSRGVKSSPEHNLQLAQLRQKTQKLKLHLSIVF